VPRGSMYTFTLVNACPYLQCVRARLANLRHAKHMLALRELSPPHLEHGFFLSVRVFIEHPAVLGNDPVRRKLARELPCKLDTRRAASGILRTRH
jgi:hypothetical protein